MMRLREKVAVVTGGARGIGNAVVSLFRQNGAKVVNADFSFTKRCDSESNSLTQMHCDVSKEDDVRSVIDAAVSKHGHLDILVNNAGVFDRPGNPPSIKDLESADFARVMSVNLNGCVFGVKHAARVMKAGGSIICMSSVASLTGGLSPYGYCVSKHAILGLVKNAAAELGQNGI